LASQKGRTRKLDPHFIGPYPILRIHSSNTADIKIGRRIVTYHFDLLKKGAKAKSQPRAGETQSKRQETQPSTSRDANNAPIIPQIEKRYSLRPRRKTTGGIVMTALTLWFVFMNSVCS